MVRGAVAAAFSLLLAGCVGGGTPSGIQGLPETSDATGAAAGVTNATIPLAGPAIDPWEGAAEKVLFEGTIESGQCYELATVWEFVYGTYVMLGCAAVPHQDGTRILVGSKRLTLEVDASQAQAAGNYLAFLYTQERWYWKNANGASTTEKVHTWTWDLQPADWDDPTGTGTGLWAGLWGDNGGVVGPVKIRTVLTRDARWEAKAPPDAWQNPTGHRMVRPGVMNLLDTNTTIRDQAHPTLGSGVDPDPWELREVVPYGTQWLTVGLRHGPIQNCPQGLECWVWMATFSGGWWRGDPAEEGDGWRILKLKVPEDAAPDNPYVKQSGTRIFAGIWHCWPDDCQVLGDACVCQERTTASRFLVDAWQAEPDLAFVKSRLGVS